MAKSNLPEIQRRMRHYLMFRVLATVLGFLLVTFYLSCLPAATRDATSSFLYGVLSVYLGVGILSLLTYPKWRQHRGLHRRQVLVDFGFQTILVWFTGGVASIFSPILFVTLAAATGIASPKGSNALATLATAVFAVTTLLFCFGFTPETSSWSKAMFESKSSVFLTSYLLANVLALYVISSLGSRLSKGLTHVEYLQEEIIENMAEGLLAVDRELRVVHLNSEARKLFGLDGSVNEYRHKPLSELLFSDQETKTKDTAAKKALQEALTTGKRGRFETSFQGAGGVIRPVEIKISSVLDEKNRLRCRVGLFSDLTLKQEVQAAEKRIEKLEELQVMAMGIAHEIRNPLASVRGCVQEIDRLAAGHKAMSRFSSIVMRESDRVDRIIEDFLRYTRSQAVDLVPMDLASVIDEATILLSRRLDFGKRCMEWKRPRGQVRIYGDRDRMLQVFLNLGINALQATDPTTGVIRVEIHKRPLLNLERRGSQDIEREMVPGVEVAVIDNGDGFTNCDVPQAFTPFYTTKEEGSGLGLSIVERIVNEHMGQIDIDPEFGDGARICIRLPVWGDEASEQLAELPQAKNAAAEVICNA